MKIALCAYEFKNNDIDFNIRRIENALKETQGRAELAVMGEAFLQGFDALSWNYEADKSIALSADSNELNNVCAMTAKYGVDLVVGYIERDGESIYSSCMLIENGKVLHNYRRISAGWKEIALSDEHYREGETASEFIYKNKKLMLALCGDMWDYPERFKTDGLLIWPVYVNYDLADWENELPEYAAQAQLVSNNTLMVNSLTADPPSIGGAFHFVNGKTAASAPFGKEHILIVDV